MFFKVLRFIVAFIGGIVALIAIAWAFGAIVFDGPFKTGHGNSWLACGWLLVVVAALVIQPKWAALCGVALLWLTVLGMELTIRPTNNRDWPPELARTADADIAGDAITLQNVRNFDYRKDAPPIENWETRTMHLSNLRGADFFLNYWGSPWIAHPILSFDFGPEGRIAFSIETRPDKTESYSTLGGLYRQFELIYVVADERDVIRVRTNYRNNGNGEDVYLFKLRTRPDRLPLRFLEYVRQVNGLHRTPRFYNVISHNCTTSIQSQAGDKTRLPADWRVLLNGKMDEWLDQLGAFEPQLPLAELKERGHINARAHIADRAPDFSARIREGVPGFPAPRTLLRKPQ